MSLDIYGRIKTAECECPNCKHSFNQYKEVFDLNITSNLRKMCDAANLGFIWDANQKKAWQLIERLSLGIQELIANPSKYDVYADSDGWGTRPQLISFLTDLHLACCEYPQATVEVSY